MTASCTNSFAPRFPFMFLLPSFSLSRMSPSSSSLFERSDDSRNVVLRRPVELPDSPSSAQRRNGGGWFSNVVSSVGKLVSAVFDSDSASSRYSSEEDAHSNSNGHISLNLRDEDELNEKSKTTKLIKDWPEGSVVVVTEIKTKSAIEHLLQQETFTRDECDKLTKIIQSQVVDIQSAEADVHHIQKGSSNIAVSKAIDCPQFYQSLHQSEDLAEGTSSPPIQKSLSPGLYPGQAGTIDFPDSAINEVKRWLESMQSSPSSKTPDHRPCTLNTDMLQSDFQGVTSPVDVAKSYMQSLRACHSASLSTDMLETTPCNKISLCMDEKSCPTSCPPFSSTKVRKRDHPIVDVRRVRYKSAEKCFQELQDNGICEISESGERVQEAEGVQYISNYSVRSGTLDSCSISPEALHAKDGSAIRALRQSDKSAVEHVNALAANNVPSASNVSDTDTVVDVKSTQILKQSAIPIEPTHSKDGGGICFPVPVIFMPSEKDIEEILSVTQQYGTLKPDELAIADELIKYVKRLKEEPSSMSTIKEEPFPHDYQRTQEIPRETATGIPIHPSCISKGRHDGKMPMENIMPSFEAQPRIGQSRVRKAAGRPRRGRGKDNLVI